jgi:hypothetical protein
LPLRIESDDQQACLAHLGHRVSSSSSSTSSVNHLQLPSQAFIIFHQHQDISSKIFHISSDQVFCASSSSLYAISHHLQTLQSAIYQLRLFCFHCTTFSACHSSRRISCAHFRQFSNSELFSFFLTFLLTGDRNSGLQSTFLHFKLHILHILFLFTFTSLHFIAPAAHDKFSRQQVFQQSFFRHQVLQQPFFRHQNHQQPLFHLSDNHLSTSATTFYHQNISTIFTFFSRFSFQQVHFFDKTRGFGTIRVCTQHPSFLKTITNTQEVQIQVFRGEQGICSTHKHHHVNIFNIFHLSTQLLRKKCPALHHQHLRHLSQQSTKTPTTNYSLETRKQSATFSPQHHTSEVFSPLLFTNSSHPHCNKKPLTILFWPSLTTVFFLRADIFHLRKVG